MENGENGSFSQFKQKSTVKGVLTEDDLRSLVESEEIKYVCVCIPTLGNVFHKNFSAPYFVKNVLDLGFKFPELVSHFNIANEILENENISFNSVNDCLMEIDKSTIRRMCWLGKEYATCIGIYKDYSNGLHWAYPRNVLMKSIERLKEKYGVHFMGASELEFYILNDEPEKITKNYPEINLEKYKISERSSDYCVGSIQARNEPFTKKIKENLVNCGIVLESIFSEHGPGQHEVNIKYGEILKNCNDHINLKQSIKHTAYENGKTASFMAKPFMNFDGSSCHVHLSAYDLKTGTNIFATNTELKEENYTISTGNPRLPTVTCSIKMIHFIGGILKYLEDFFLIYAPTINSYKRFKKNSFAPSVINTWCYDSRLASVRVIGTGDDFHLEIRIGGADVNPYLIFSAIIESGMKGIEDKVLPPTIQSGNIYEKNDEKFVYAPKNLYESCKLFEKSEFVEDVLGKKMKQSILDFARMEWEEFMNHVSNWEVNRYLDLV